jgi:hypothetical protein
MLWAIKPKRKEEIMLPRKTIRELEDGSIAIKWHDSVPDKVDMIVQTTMQSEGVQDAYTAEIRVNEILDDMMYQGWLINSNEGYWWRDQ